MDNETLFYATGIALAVSAVVFSFVALRFEGFPGRATPIVALWFIALVGCAATFSVLHAQDHKAHREPGLSEATEEAELEEDQ